MLLNLLKNRSFFLKNKISKINPSQNQTALKAIIPSRSLFSLSLFSCHDKIEDLIGKRNQLKNKLKTDAILGINRTLDHLFDWTNGLADCFTQIALKDSSANSIHESINRAKSIMDSQILSVLQTPDKNPFNFSNKLTEEKILGIFGSALNNSFFEGILKTLNVNPATGSVSSCDDEGEKIDVQNSSETQMQKKLQFRVEDKTGNNSRTEAPRERTELCYVNLDIEFGLIIEAKIDEEQYQFPALTNTEFFDETVDRIFKIILILGVLYNRKAKRSEIWYKLIDKKSGKTLEGIAS